MDYTNLNDEQRAAAAGHAAHDVEMAAYMAEIAAHLGLDEKKKATDLKRAARKAAKAAADRGAQGPYFTPAERFMVWRNNVQALETQLIAIEVQQAAGVDPQGDADSLKEQHDKLLEVKPPEPSEPDGIGNANLGRHPGSVGPRSRPGGQAAA